MTPVHLVKTNNPCIIIIINYAEIGMTGALYSLQQFKNKTKRSASG